MLNVSMPSAVIKSVIMLSAIMLNVSMLSVIMLSVVAPLWDMAFADGPFLCPSFKTQ